MKHNLHTYSSALRAVRYFVMIGLVFICQTIRAYAPEKELAPKALGVGNLVFLDFNRNGIQDTGEPGVANVRVRLYQRGIERAQLLTDLNGQYNFTSANVSTGLLPNTAYEVRILPGDFPANLKLTKPVQGGNPELDSDAQLIGGNAVIFVTTNNGDTPNDSYDIGFVAGNPDLLISKLADSQQVVMGGSAAFTIQISNTGSGAATNVVISDTLDAGLAYVSSSPTATTVAFRETRILTWNLGTLMPGAVSNLTVTTTVQKEGVLYNTAYATTTDTENSLANNAGSTCVTVPIMLCAGSQYVANLPVQYVNVQWFKDGVTTPVGSGNSFTIVAAGNYTFTSTDGAACPANGCCPIIVEAGTVPSLTITPDSPVICAGQSTSLAVSGCSAGSLLWSENAASATTATVAVSPATTTVYSVTCTPTAYGTCPGVTSTTVTVNPSVTATLSSATICNGTSATLTASGGSTYAFSDGTTNSTGVLVVSPTVNDPTLYSVTVTSGLGCSAVASGTVTVNPSATATITASSASVCQGESITLTASGGNSYIWSTGETTAIISVTATATYSVTAISAQGCTGVDSTTVTINQAPQLTINSVTVCAGNTTTLTVGGCIGGSLAWDTGDTTASLIIAPLVTTAYSATCTLPTGCMSSVSTTVAVNEAPTYTMAPVVIPATCLGAVANNDAHIDLTSLQNTERVDISVGSTYTGPAYGAGSNKPVSGGVVSFTNLPNPSSPQAYTIRLYTAGGSCFSDVTVLLNPADCQCSIKCAPIVITKIR
jgi:uncharacterized repeat protein (TIGR01451 family)